MSFPSFDNPEYKKTITMFLSENIDPQAQNVNTAEALKIVDKNIKLIFKQAIYLIIKMNKVHEQYINKNKEKGGITYKNHNDFLMKDKFIVLNPCSIPLLQKISNQYFECLLIYERCMGKNYDDYAKKNQNALHPNIFDHLSKNVYNICLWCSPDNPLINDFFGNSPISSYESSKHFVKEWQAALDHQCTDVIFTVADKEYYAHRAKLSMHSDVFEKMLQGDFGEGQKELVQIKECKPQVFEALLKFIYLGTLDNNELQKINLLELFKAAFKFNVIELEHFCADRFNKHLKNDELDGDTFCDAMRMGLLNQSTDLLKVCLAYVEKKVQLEKNVQLQEKFIELISDDTFTKTEKDFCLLINLCKEMNSRNTVLQLLMLTKYSKYKTIRNEKPPPSHTKVSIDVNPTSTFF